MVLYRMFAKESDVELCDPKLLWIIRSITAKKVNLFYSAFDFYLEKRLKKRWKIFLFARLLALASELWFALALKGDFLF